MSTQVFEASTLFGAMTLAAAIDDGRFGPADQRRVLIVSNNAPIPEVRPGLETTAGFAALRDRFDEIVLWNQFLHPLHPSDWRPRDADVPLLARLLATHLGLDGPPSELVVESLAVPPALTLAALLPDVPITVYSDGLMSYGPTRFTLRQNVVDRVERLVYLDLVPRLTPLLLHEAGVRLEALSADAFRAVVSAVAAQPSVAADLATLGTPEAPALIVGQYLAALDILPQEHEAALYTGLLRALHARGHRHVLFKPHPGAGRTHVRAMRRDADRLGIDVMIVPEALPAEVLFQTLRPALVVGCFSTALLTARELFDIPIATTSGELILDKLTPYENSNRIPATIVDAVVPRLAPDGTISDAPDVDLPSLVGAVSYCMQSDHVAHLHATAVDYVAAHGRLRYFKKRRLVAVGILPPPSAAASLARRSAARLARTKPLASRRDTVDRLRRAIER